MTKTIIIGLDIPARRPEKIKFDYSLCDVVPKKTALERMVVPPATFSYIELVCLNYIKGKDLMFAYNDPEQREDGILIIGKWNDGVV